MSRDAPVAAFKMAAATKKFGPKKAVTYPAYNPNPITLEEEVTAGVIAVMFVSLIFGWLMWQLRVLSGGF